MRAGWYLSLLVVAGCGARSSLVELSGDAAPDAPAGCRHPAVEHSCTDGWCTVPAGCFLMGSATDEPCREREESEGAGRETPHEVTISRSFEILSTEVTCSQFEARMGYSASSYYPDSPQCPEVDVTRHQAEAYCNALSSAAGLETCYACTGSKWDTVCQLRSPHDQKIQACPGYRLPTEAEWEYAYRAGTATAFYSGAIDAASCASCEAKDANADAIGWYCFNSPGTYPGTAAVASRTPNGWGLFDMAGNVWEWTADGFRPDLGTQPTVDPWTPDTGEGRTIRGGNGFSAPRQLRAAHRIPATAGYHGIGLRCVRTLAP